MKLTRCNNGHYYDADRYSTCPHCNSSVVDVTRTVPEGYNNNPIDRTEADPSIERDKKEEKSLEKVIKEASGSTSAIDDEQKTIGIFSTGVSGDSAPVVGWLVCVKGNHYGEDFRLVAGRNFVGRSSSMEVCLSGDTSISREKHLIIVFEPKQNTFIVQPGDSKELSYLNDEVILQSKVMNSGDSLVMGNSQFVFVPFCTNEINWSNFENKE